MADVFISYHTKSAKNIADQLCSELESRGISCWYAPRDVDPGAYKSSIAAAIRDCKVFLLILNPEADKSEQVKDEVHLARRIYDENQKVITILPIRLNHCHLSDEMYMEISRFHMFEISNESGTPGKLMKLVKASAGIAQNKKERGKNKNALACYAKDIAKIFMKFIIMIFKIICILVLPLWLLEPFEELFDLSALSSIKAIVSTLYTLILTIATVILIIVIIKGI